MANAIEASQITKHYGSGRGRTQVLHGVDLVVQAGRIIALTGPSGCGKTTLLNCLSGIDRPDGGRVLVGGKDLAQMGDRARTKHRGQHMGYVFQAFNLVPVLDAVQNVELPLRLAGVRPATARAAAMEALYQVDLGEKLKSLPGELSGGQQQRVAIARALVNKPSVVWADEPTGNLDRASGTAVLDLLDRAREEQGITVVVVTHDDAVAARAGQVMTLEEGRLTDATA